MNVLELFSKITTFVFDVDGVLTDGTVLVLPNGVQARQMHIKDGFALQMAIKNGFKVLVISGGTSEPVVDRLNKLGITEVYMTVADKKDITPGSNKAILTLGDGTTIVLDTVQTGLLALQGQTKIIKMQVAEDKAT